MRTVTTRSIGGRVKADGTVASGGSFTSRKTATGTYIVNVPAGFRLTGVAANFDGATFILATASMINDSSFQTNTYNSSTGAAADAQFSFTATGVGV